MAPDIYLARRFASRYPPPLQGIVVYYATNVSKTVPTILLTGLT